MTISEVIQYCLYKSLYMYDIRRYKNIPALTFIAAQYCRMDSVMAIKRCVSDRRKQHNTTVRQDNPSTSI